MSRSQSKMSLHDIALSAANASADRFNIVESTRGNYKTYLNTVAEILVKEYGPMAALYGLRHTSEELMAFVNDRSGSQRGEVSTNIGIFAEFRRQLAAFAFGE